MQTPFGDHKELGDYSISHMSYFSFFKNKKSIKNIIKNGFSGSSLHARFKDPGQIQKMYLDKDPDYFSFLSAFKERYDDYDIIVMNPGVDLVHPEFLEEHFPNALKCMHFVDDPHATYAYGFPYAWAFDCATYISPSYNENYSMAEILTKAGFEKKKWFPLCNSNLGKFDTTIENFEEQLQQRNNKAIYVGAFYTGKQDRLAYLKSQLGNEFDIFGRYPFYGLPFSILSTLSGMPTAYRVKSITNRQREEFYSEYSIAINMHLSDPSLETGNARLYEVASRGLAQVVDTSEHSLVHEIFTPEKEILLYSNIEECVKQVNRLRNDKDLRVRIALAAYKRSIKEYYYPDRLVNVLDWFKSMI